jgi:WD40 repeat protein
VVLWDAEAGAPIRELARIKDQSGSGVAFSPDGARIAAAGAAGTVSIWNSADGSRVLTIADGTRAAEQIAWAPAGNVIAVASADGAVKLLDAASGAETARFAHGGGTTFAAFNRDGRYLAIGSTNRATSVWNVSSGVRTATLQGHGDAVYSAAFSPDGSRLSTVSADRSLRIWDTASGQCLLTVPALEAVYATDWSPDGTRVVMAILDKSIRLLDAVAVAERARQ